MSIAFVAICKRDSERASRTAGKQGAPPVKPGLSCSGAQHLRLIPSLSWTGGTGCQYFTWRVAYFSLSARDSAPFVFRTFSSVAWTLRGYFSVSLGLRIKCGRTIVLLTNDPRTWCWFMNETTRVSFTTLSICFLLIAFFHFPLDVDFLSCLTLRILIVWSIWSLTAVFNLELITEWPIVSNSFLVIQSQYSLKLNRVLQFWLVQSFQDNFCRCFTCW